MEIGCGETPRLETRASNGKEEERTANGVDGAQAGIAVGREELDFVKRASFSHNAYTGGTFVLGVFEMYN